MYSKFIQIGDAFKSEEETFNTHKGMSYLVSHVFNDNGLFRVFITDKNGKDVEIKSEYSYSPTAKTVSASNSRQKKSKLDFLWNNPSTNLVYNKTYNKEDRETIEFNKYHISSYHYTGVEAKIYRKNKDGFIEGSESKIRTITELYNYFKDFECEKITIKDVFYTNQQDIDHIQFLLTIPHFNQKLLNFSEKPDVRKVDDYIHSEKPDLETFITLCSEVIFDEPILSNENKKIIYNIVESYELLPKSYGPTGAARLMMGKEKKQNKTVAHLSGTCTKLKQPQMFELCNFIESFMYVSGILSKIDVYSMAEEWRYAYEYIGTKSIHTNKLLELKTRLS